MASATHSDIYLGIDVGTSGIRAIAIDTDGNIHGNSQHPLPDPVTVAEQGVEQDANLWWQTLCNVFDELATNTTLKNIKFIAIDGTSATVLVADSDGEPLAPALMYNDARSSTQVAQLADIAPANAPVHQTSAALPKIMWLLEQTRSKQTNFILHQADWLAGKLLGQFGVSDVNNCLKTGYDPLGKCWPEWLQQTGINTSLLPRVFIPGTPIGKVNKHIAQQFGLHPETQIVAGTTDSTAAIIATGAQQVGDAITSLGSTLVLKIIHDKPLTNMEYGIYSQPLYVNDQMKWLVGGASNTGGAVLRKYFTPAELVALSERIDVNKTCDHDYYPLLQAGERFPLNDPELQPRLTPRPEDDAEFLYGLFSAIANIEQQGYQRLQQLGAQWPTRVFSSGGGSVNPIWTRIRKTKLRVEMVTPVHTEAAYGAALLARQAGR